MWEDSCSACFLSGDLKDRGMMYNKNTMLLMLVVNWLLEKLSISYWEKKVLKQKQS